MVGVTRTARHWLFILMTSLTVVACGGGGGSRSADTLPDNFAPNAPQTGIPVGTAAEFPAFEVTGVDDSVAISIQNGAFVIGEGDTFVTTATVMNGDSVRVQVTASDSFLTQTTATLTIGSGEADFIITSEAMDIEPETFELGDPATVNSAEEQAESASFTVLGINAPTSISIANGEYRIGTEGTYTNVAGTVSLNDSVQVRATSGTSAPSDTVATLTVGTQTDTFTVNLVDAEPPQAEVIFPTPATMTDGTSITLRGKATDDFGPIASIRVTVTTDEGATAVDSETINATDTDDFSDIWSINVDLGAEKINTIAVEAVDAAGNVQAEPTVITMLQAADALNTNFPVGNDVFIGEISARGFALDNQNARLLIVENGDLPGDILSVDLATGERTVFLENNSDMESAGAMHLVESTAELFVVDINGDAIFKTSLESPALISVASVEFPESESPATVPYGFRFDETSQLLVGADRANRIFTVNPSDGILDVISDNVSNPNEPLFQTPTDLIINDTSRSLLVTDSTAFDESVAGTVLEVDISDGSRSNIGVQEGADFGRPFGIEWLVQDEIAIVTSRSTEGRNEPGRILMFDLAQNMLTTIAANDFPEGSANNIQVPQFLSIDQEGELVYIVSGAGFADSRSSILVLDGTTGERVVLTRSVISLF